MGKKGLLLYHRVNDTVNDYNRITVEEKHFYKHMCHLKENYKILTFEEILSYEGEEDAISVTFDDGFADFYEKALPILTQLQIPSTIFITTGKIDTVAELWTTEILRILFASNTGEELRIKIYNREVVLPIFTLEQRVEAYRILRHVLMQLSTGEREEILTAIRKELGVDEKGRAEYRLLSSIEIREIASNPLVTIGAHTVNHVSVGRISETELVDEIRESVKHLEHIIGRKVKYFAYPFGGAFDYSDKVIDILREDGIEAACTVEERVYDKNTDSLYEIPRKYIGNWNLKQFQDRIQKWFGEQEQEKVREHEEPQIYIGKLETDRKLWESDRKIVIWGTGVRGKRVYESLCGLGQAYRVIAFGDNNSMMWGQQIDDVPVWNIEQIKKCGEVDIVIYNVHDNELIQQLVEQGARFLHWVI